MTTTPTEAKPSTASRSAARKSQEPPARIVIQYPTPAVDGGRYAAKRCVGDHRHRRGRRFPRRPRPPPGRRPLQGARRRPLPGVRDAPDRRAPRRRPLGRQLRCRPAGPLGVHGRRRGPTCSATWRDELERKVAAGQHDLAGELSEGVLLLRTRIEERHREGRQSAHRARRRDARRRGRPRGGQARRRARPRAVRRRSSGSQPRHGTVTLPEPVRDRGRSAQSPVRQLVRAVPALLGRPEGRRAPATTHSRSSGSTSSTSRRSTRSA